MTTTFPGVTLAQTPKEQKQLSTNSVTEVSTPWRCKVSEVGIKFFTKKMLLMRGAYYQRDFCKERCDCRRSLHDAVFMAC